MSSLLTLAKDLEQKSKEQQQTTGEMLKAAFSEHEQSVRQELNESAKRINAAISDHDQKLASAMSQRTKGMVRMVSQTWLTIVLVSILLTASSAGILWWQGQQILDNYMTIREQKSTQAMLSERNNGVQLSICGTERQRCVKVNTEAMLSERNNGVQLSICGTERQRCVKVNTEAGRFGEDSSWMILAGK